MWRRDPDFSTGHPDIGQCSKALRAKKRGDFVIRAPARASSNRHILVRSHVPLHRLSVSESSFCRLLSADALRQQHHIQPALLDSVPGNCCISRIPAPIVPAFPSRQEPDSSPLASSSPALPSPDRHWHPSHESSRLLAAPMIHPPTTAPRLPSMAGADAC